MTLLKFHLGANGTINNAAVSDEANRSVNLKMYILPLIKMGCQLDYNYQREANLDQINWNGFCKVKFDLIQLKCEMP